MRTKKLICAILAAGLILSLLITPAYCTEIIQMAPSNLRSSEQVLKMYGHEVIAHNGVIIGTKESIKQGTAVIVIRGHTNFGTWTLFRIETKNLRVISIQCRPAKPPVPKTCL